MITIKSWVKVGRVIVLLMKARERGYWGIGTLKTQTNNGGRKLDLLSFPQRRSR